MAASWACVTWPVWLRTLRGATPALAALAGAAWLTLPSVFLQLPTDSVDLGTAATLLGAAFLTLVFGAQMYVEMWLRHGNPVWPVVVKLGPLTLPGGVQRRAAPGRGPCAAAGAGRRHSAPPRLVAGHRHAARL